MKKFYISLSILLLIIDVAVAQFEPPAGQPGTSAIHADSSVFVAWATGSRINRGFKNISVPASGNTSVGDSTSVIGKPDGVSVVSLGDGGSAIVTFAVPIADGPGYDFAVFENGFDDTFLELAFVEVSSDGTNFFRIPATSNTQESVQTGSFASTDATRINNLAGKYRSPYGTPFNLSEVSGIPELDIQRITHVKIVDVVGCIQDAYATYDKNGHKVNDPWPTDFASGGFDLDGIGVIHQATLSSVSELSAGISFQLYPNPVNKNSSLSLHLQSDEPVTIDVVDMTGRQVALIASRMSVHEHALISLDRLNLKKGLYLLRVSAGQHVKTEKIMVLDEY